MFKGMTLLSGLSLAAVLLLAACNGGEGAQPSPTPGPTATPTAEPTPTATPIPKPDPQTLLQPGYVLDQALELSLDGGETGQIVVISHTIRIDKQGQRAVATVPEECPDNTILLGDPSPCAFRMEVFTYDPASGWTSKFLQDADDPVTEGGYVLPGITQGVQARAVATGEDGLQSLLVTYVKCAASNCPVEHHLVLAMKDSVITEVYNAFKARLQLGPTTAILNEPEYAPDDGLCCPSARRITTIGLDPNTGEVGVIDVQIEPVGP